MRNKELIEVLDYEIEQLVKKIKKARDNDNFGTYKNLILSLKEVLRLKSEESEMSYYLENKDSVVTGVSGKNSRSEAVLSKDRIVCKFDSKISEVKYIPDISKIVLALCKIENNKQHELRYGRNPYELEIEGKYYDFVSSLNVHDKVIINGEIYVIYFIRCEKERSSKIVLKRIEDFGF